MKQEAALIFKLIFLQLLPALLPQAIRRRTNTPKRRHSTQISRRTTPLIAPVVPSSAPRFVLQPQEKEHVHSCQVREIRPITDQIFSDCQDCMKMELKAVYRRIDAMRDFRSSERNNYEKQLSQLKLDINRGTKRTRELTGCLEIKRRRIDQLEKQVKDYEKNLEKEQRLVTPANSTQAQQPVLRNPSTRRAVFLEFEADNFCLGQMHIILYNDVAPITAENFRALCTGERGNGVSGTPLHYKGSKVLKSIPGFIIQAGDITHQNGMGGESIYGVNFADENFLENHDVAGMLSMANLGMPNTNGSQFFLTLGKAPWLDGKHVVFGRMVAGVQILKMIERMGSADGTLSKEVIISNCGELEITDE